MNGSFVLFLVYYRTIIVYAYKTSYTMYNASTGYNARKARKARRTRNARKARKARRTMNTRNTRNTMNTRNARNTRKARKARKARAGSMSMPLPVEGRVTVYGKATCPWCNKMKPLLVPGRDKYVEITLHNMPEFRKHIVPRIHGYKSVPIVFVGTKFIGGYSEYVKL